MRLAAKGSLFRKCVSRMRLSTLRPNLSKAATCSSLRNSWEGLDGHSLTTSSWPRKSQIWVETWWFPRNYFGNSKPKRTISWWPSTSADRFTKSRKARLRDHRPCTTPSAIGSSMRLRGKPQENWCSNLHFLRDLWIGVTCCARSKWPIRNAWSSSPFSNNIFHQFRPSTQNWTRRSVLFRGSCCGACASIFQKMRMTTPTNK